MKDKDIELEMTMEQFKKAEVKADEILKESNGHSYEHMLKTRCQFCGKSPKDKRRCGQWFQTFLFRLDYVLLNKLYE